MHRRIAPDILLFALLLAEESSVAVEKGKPVEITIKSSVDGADQPNLIQVPTDYDGSKPVPLLVGLHSWSAAYRQQAKAMGPLALARGWLLVLPNFRGPNQPKNPKATEACASILAQHDVIDSVNYMTKHFNVDKKRIYLTGGSGGGHMAHMMAAKYPDVWAGVSAWVSITDIRTWHGENKGYARGVEACSGGKPGESPEVDWEYFRRSPVHFIANALNLPMDIHHGRDDKSVPYHHSVDSYNKLKEAGSTKATLDVFDGGHEFKVEPAIEWLAKQVKDDTPLMYLNLTTEEAKSYYYAFLVPAEEMKPGRCTIRIREGKEIDITADSLKELRLDWGAMGVGAKEAHLNVRKVTNPMKLHVENIAIAEIECGKKIAHTWEIDPQKKALIIAVDPTVAPVTYVLKQ